MLTAGRRHLGLEYLRGVTPEMVACLEQRRRENPVRPASPEVGAERKPLHDRAALLSLLGEAGGNVSSVARQLGTTRAQVYRWMSRLGIQRPAGSG